MENLPEMIQVFEIHIFLFLVSMSVIPSNDAHPNYGVLFLDAIVTMLYVSIFFLLAVFLYLLLISINEVHPEVHPVVPDPLIDEETPPLPLWT